MLDKLQVSGVVKNYLIAIDNELQENYTKMINTANEDLDLAVTDFVDSITALLDYYAEPIFKSGRSVITKRIDNTSINEFTEDEQAVVNDYRTNKLEKLSLTMKDAIKTCFDDREDDDELYDQIICVIVANCIRFFKKSQLQTCQKLGIDEVRLTSSKESCQICQAKAKFKHKVSDLLNEVDEFHPFCKLAIELDSSKPTNVSIPKTAIMFDNIPSEYVSRAKNVVGTLKIYAKDLITEKPFSFVDDVLSNGLSRVIKAKYGSKADEICSSLQSGTMFFENEDKILVANNCTSELEHIIVSNLLKDKLLEKDGSWWRDEFAKRLSSKYIGDNCAVFAKPFVNYAAEQDWQSYLVESAVFYILEPRLLKEIDQENYDRLKTFVFNDIEFMRG